MEMLMQQELMDQARSVRYIADYFMAMPHVQITQDTLKAVGHCDAARSRVSDCRRRLKMHIETVKTYYIGDDGKRRQGLSDYIYRPQAQLGPEAGTYRERSLF